MNDNIAIDTQQKILAVADEIRRYLEKRPNAAETIDGLAQWWLARQRYEDSKELVQAALEFLVSSGLVVCQNSGGRSIYRKAS